jgi:hypothetical protein
VSIFTKRSKPSRPSLAELNAADVDRNSSTTWAGTAARPFQTQSALNPVGAALEAQIKQLKFLLAIAPMIDAPTKYDARMWFARAQAPFGYIHPKTMAHYAHPMDKTPHGMALVPGSPTKWVLTSLMPEGRVILSPLPAPGLEKILAQ